MTWPHPHAGWFQEQHGGKPQGASTFQAWDIISVVLLWITYTGPESVLERPTWGLDTGRQETSGPFLWQSAATAAFPSLRCAQMLEINWPVFINLIIVRYLKSFKNMSLCFARETTCQGIFEPFLSFISFSLSAYVSLLNGFEVSTRMDVKMGFDKVWGVNAMKTLVPVKATYAVLWSECVSPKSVCWHSNPNIV